MEPSAFDELAFFRAIDSSGAHALLIGRRALVLLGLPVLTADYDFWIAIEDIAIFNAACAPFRLVPTHEPEAARRHGRYVLENDERIDVLVARSIPTVDGRQVEFEALWASRRRVDIAEGSAATLPSLDGLILTKQVSARPKDLEDIRLLHLLRSQEAS